MNHRLVIITILASVGYYNFHNAFSSPICRFMFICMVILCFITAIKQQSVRLRECNFPRLPWFVFVCGLIVSTFMASFFHPQTLQASIIAQSTAIVAFCFFFALLKLNPDPDKLIKSFFYLAGCSIFVYFANLATFPNNIFGEPIVLDTSRGMIRVAIPLFQIMLLLIFYSINQWQLTKSKKWLLILGIGGVMIILSLTRQVMAIMFTLCFFQILHKYSLWKKIVVGVILLSSGYIIFTSLPIYKDIKELSETQIDSSVNKQEEDVRVGAWRYYSYESNENIATFLFGNGTPSFGKSVWGKHFDVYTSNENCYLADVSWAGCIFLYGAIATIALLCIVILAIFKPKKADQQYLTYYMICVLLQGIASGVWYYYYELEITMVVLYLIYRKKDQDNTPANTPHPGKLQFITE